MLKVRNFFLLILILGVIFVICYCYWNYQQEQINSLNEILETLKREINSSSLNNKDYFTTKRDFLRLENTLKGSVFQLASSLFFGVTVFIAWLNFVVSDQKQVAERFATAVEQLGSEQLGVKVGGIFALEKVAETSPETHWQVIEVLTSYIRDQSFKGKSVSKPEIKEEDNQSEELNVQKASNKVAAERATSVTIDIQTALTVICRRNYRQDPKDKVINLKSCDIRGANLEKANLNNVDLRHSNLDRVVLTNADLSKARLERALLNEANLERVNLQNADLNYVQLQESNLKNAKLNYSKLYRTNFRAANLQGTNLKPAKFKLTNLRDAKINSQTILPTRWRKIHEIHLNGGQNQIFDSFNFSEGELSNTNFQEASLMKAKFDGADLNRANFQYACLKEASFKKTDTDIVSNLEIAHFSGADLEGAVFEQAILRLAHFEPVHQNQQTNLNKVIFERVDLEGVQFQHTSLIEAEFIGCMLKDANFYSADLREAKFENCFCIDKNVNFENADIDQAEFKGLFGRTINSIKQARNYHTANFS